MSESQQLPTLRTWFGVQYPDINRVIRVASAEVAQETAAAYPGAVAVACSVGDWSPIGVNTDTAIRNTLMSYSEWLEMEGAMVGIHLEPRAHDELVADFLSSAR